MEVFTISPSPFFQKRGDNNKDIITIRNGNKREKYNRTLIIC